MDRRLNVSSAIFEIIHWFQYLQWELLIESGNLLGKKIDCE